MCTGETISDPNYYKENLVREILLENGVGEEDIEKTITDGFLDNLPENEIEIRKVLKAII